MESKYFYLWYVNLSYSFKCLVHFGAFFSVSFSAELLLELFLKSGISPSEHPCFSLLFLSFNFRSVYYSFILVFSWEGTLDSFSTRAVFYSLYKLESHFSGLKSCKSAIESGFLGWVYALRYLFCLLFLISCSLLEKLVLAFDCSSTLRQSASYIVESIKLLGGEPIDISID